MPGRGPGPVVGDQECRPPAERRPVGGPCPGLLDVALGRTDGQLVPVLELGGRRLADAHDQLRRSADWRGSTVKLRRRRSRRTTSRSMIRSSSRRRASVVGASRRSWRCGWSTWMIPDEEVGQDRRVVRDRHPPRARRLVGVVVDPLATVAMPARSRPGRSPRPASSSRLDLDPDVDLVGVLALASAGAARGSGRTAGSPVGQQPRAASASPTSSSSTSTSPTRYGSRPTVTDSIRNRRAPTTSSS